MRRREYMGWPFDDPQKEPEMPDEPICAWCLEPAVEWVLIEPAHYRPRVVEKDGVKTRARICVAPERRSPACGEHAERYRMEADDIESAAREARSQQKQRSTIWKTQQETLL